MSYRRELHGVTNLATGEIVLPGMPAWRDYEAWLVAGGVPEPRIVPPADLEAQAEIAARVAMRATLRADTVVQYLRTHTPAEVAAYVAANVADLASARSVLSKMAMVVAYLARERLVPEPTPPVDKPMP